MGCVFVAVLEKDLAEAEALFAVQGVFAEELVVDVVAVYLGAESEGVSFSSLGACRLAAVKNDLGW